MLIRHLTHNSIDKKKWDELISSATNGLIYAKSWYLDIVSPNWEALVSDDYSYVFPIPIKRKYKLPYIVQPPLTQQLGVFSKQMVSGDIIQLFIQRLPSYSYELNLNEHNRISGLAGEPNFVLDLSKGYQTISMSYSKNTVRNIEKAKKNQLEVVENVSLSGFIDFYRQTKKTYKTIDYECLEKLIKAGQQHNEFRLCGVFDASGEMIAALCYAEFNQRITYLVPVSNEKGKQTFAMFYLVDRIIQQESGNNKLLDFEGSKIEGVARFYKGFGAKNHPYYTLKKLRPSFLVGRI